MWIQRLNSLERVFFIERVENFSGVELSKHIHIAKNPFRILCVGREILTVNSSEIRESCSAKRIPSYRIAASLDHGAVQNTRA